ncbi:MAG: hypothetical protein KC613_14200 [Myxococcales bacterium]|nr:hypothetical protein [Myxococcales bacterium]
MGWLARTVGVVVWAALASAGAVWLWDLESRTLVYLLFAGSQAVWSTYAWRAGTPGLRTWEGPERSHGYAPWSEAGWYTAHYHLDLWLPAAIGGILAAVGALLALRVGSNRGWRWLGGGLVFLAPFAAWVPWALHWASSLRGWVIGAAARAHAAGGSLPSPVGLHLMRLDRVEGEPWPWQLGVLEIPTGQVVLDVLGMCALLALLGAAAAALVTWRGRGVWPGLLAVGALLAAAAGPSLVVAQTERAHHLQDAEQMALRFQAAAARKGDETEGPATAWFDAVDTFGDDWRALLTFEWHLARFRQIELSHGTPPSAEARRAPLSQGRWIECPEETSAGVDLRAAGFSTWGERYRLVLLDASPPPVYALPVVALVLAAVLLWGGRRIGWRWARAAVVWLALSLPTASALLDLARREAAVAAGPVRRALAGGGPAHGAMRCAVPFALETDRSATGWPPSRVGWTAGWLLLLGLGAALWGRVASRRGRGDGVARHGAVAHPRGPLHSEPP